MQLKCIVIDDERLAREYIKNYISKIPELELMGDFNSPLKATSLIKSGQVDVIFIDIQMPDITGVDFIRSLAYKPEVIFTTAYQEFALEGFELNAADYLLKPFSFERFLQAVNKVIDKYEGKTKDDAQQENPQQAEASFSEHYLTIRADRKLYKINFDDLLYVEGQKSYVTFHTAKKKITALASLKELEDKLPSKDFIRIHKSFIVAIKPITSLEGNMIEVNEVKLPVGRIYKEAVLQVFGV